MIISLTAYLLLRSNFIANHKKDTQILFYQIQSKTLPLLSQLLYEYNIQKNILLQKHDVVKKYLLSQQLSPLEVNLKTIYKEINGKESESLYNIYISDKNLVIQNSTLKKDIGFRLSFAKEFFDKHYEQNITGICTPLFEQYSQEFLSYTDSYIGKKGNEKEYLLQISYRYKNINIKSIKNILLHYPSIIEAKAYIIVNSGLINGFNLKNTPSHKLNIDEMLERIAQGKAIEEKLRNKNLLIENFRKNDTNYIIISLSMQSPIYSDTKVIYSIVFDNTDLQNTLQFLDYFITIIIFLGSLAIFATFKLRKKEIKLNKQDRFIQNSMHEIKTPLSIIALNNELRKLEFGSDEYSLEIESAIKTLKISFEDMSFAITKDEINYPTEILFLENVLKERIAYFQSIATSNQKHILLHVTSECSVKMSKVGLIRLIDNNLSNAIKYSSKNSTIRVILNANKLSFYNIGKPIQNTKNIFKKYVRENNVIGGHGLGLSIVKDIALQYKIRIEVISNDTDGTGFFYIFQCYTNLNNV